MGMVTATIIMHNGINTGGVFGHIFDFTGIPVAARAILALAVCIVLYNSIFYAGRLLYGEVQDASVYFNHGKHA